MGRVIIGVDPHKLSATIEVLDDRERVLGQGRFGTDRGGYRQMLAMARRWPERTWAVEGSQGIGRHVAQRLVADGEAVVDVPAKLSAWARVFSTGQGRKTDATDARSSPSSRCALLACRLSLSTATWSRCGYWPTAGTSSPAPEPARSADCTGCCSS